LAANLDANLAANLAVNLAASQAHGLKRPDRTEARQQKVRPSSGVAQTVAMEGAKKTVRTSTLQDDFRSERL